jgi:hypothetical protein
MKKFFSRGFIMAAILMLVAVVLGQVVSLLAAPASYEAFIALLPKYISMITFWGPIVGVIAGVLVWAVMNLLGFHSLEEIRNESVEQNNPTPAILFVGTLIASILFMLLVLQR